MLNRIVVLTGAGVSAESGLSTFRDKGGIWSQFNVEDVATPQGFARDPALVHRFYNLRRANLSNVAPNAAHVALAKLEKRFDGELVIVTQNVDDLHERGGARNVWHMHGEMKRARCAACAHRWDAPLVMQVADTCPRCAGGPTRPDIVWFGETPFLMEQIDDAIRNADLFVSIGTSGNVYPAAGFVKQALAAGAETLELNLEPSLGASDFAQARHGPATQIVPAWVDEVLAAQSGA